MPPKAPNTASRANELGRVSLGRSGLQITRVGLGAWALGGSSAPHTWSEQTDAVSAQVIERAIASGINWIDTAAIYGLGHSEELIGNVLKGVAASARPYVFTKCAAHATPQGEIYFDLRRESILREVEGSLTRLRAGAIDLYQVHRPLPAHQIEEGWRTLAELKSEGVVRHIGVSNFSAAQLERIEGIAPVETIQPPYSLLRRDAEQSLLRFAEESEIGVISYSPLASGLLSGTMTRERLQGLPDSDWRRHDERFAEPTLSRGLELVERLRIVGRELGVAPGMVAVAWALQHPAVHGVIVGFRNVRQLEELAGAAALALPAHTKSFLEAPLSDQGTTL